MEYIKLNELCEINIGKTPSRSNSDYWGIGNKWLSIADLKSKYVSEAKEEITDLAVDEAKMRVVPKNTVVMSFKLSIGKLAILQEDMYTNEAIANFRIKNKELITPEYLYYALKTLNFDNSTDRAVMGATLNKSKLNDIKIPYCKIDIQKKIVEVLDKSQSLIDKKKEQIDLLDELVKSRFVEMFGDPVLNTKEWEVKKVIDVCECMVPGRDKPKSFTGDIPWITIDDLKINRVTYKSKSCLGLTDDEIKEVKRKKIPKGSVLMSCVGNLGICSIAGEDMIINQQLHSFQCKEINNYFLMYYLGFRKDYMESKASSTTVLYMNKTVCNSIPVYLPPMELQNEFAEFITKTDSIRSKMETSLSELEDNFNSLMQKAFKGELF